MEVIVLLALLCTSVAGEWIVPGTVKNFAGNYATRGYEQGIGASAMFNMPRGMALDPTTGNLFVADYINHAIRIITPYGNVTTLNTFSGNPYGLAFNEADRCLYVAVLTTSNLGSILRVDADTAAYSVMLQSGVRIPDDPVHPIKNPQALLYDNNEKILYFSENNAALRAWPYPMSSPNTIQTLFVAASGSSWNFVRDKFYNSYMGLSSQVIEIPSVGPSRVISGTSYGGYVNGPTPSYGVVEGLAWSADQDFIYVADNGNGVMRQVFVNNGSANTVVGKQKTTAFLPGPVETATFNYASEIYAHPYVPNYYFIADQSGIRVWYGAGPVLSDLFITPNYAVQNGIFIEATLLVPLSSITEFIVILEAQGYQHEVHTTTTLPYAVVPQHLRAPYTITVVAENEYGEGSQLETKYHS